MFEHPPVGRIRSPRFSAHPPDPAPYLKKAVKEFTSASRTLERAGLSSEQLFLAMGRIISPPEESDKLVIPSPEEPDIIVAPSPEESDKHVAPSPEESDRHVAPSPEESNRHVEPSSKESGKPDDLPLSPHIFENIVKKIFEVQPAAGQEAIVLITDLRAAVNLPKETFDMAVLVLADRDILILHRHVHVDRLSKSEREALVLDQWGNYYMGVVLRSDA